MEPNIDIVGYFIGGPAHGDIKVVANYEWDEVPESPRKIVMDWVDDSSKEPVTFSEPVKRHIYQRIFLKNGLAIYVDTDDKKIILDMVLWYFDKHIIMGHLEELVHKMADYMIYTRGKSTLQEMLNEFRERY